MYLLPGFFLCLSKQCPPSLLRLVSNSFARWQWWLHVVRVKCNYPKSTDIGPPPLLPPTRRGLYGWRPGHSDRTGKSMRPQVGEHCVKDTTEEEQTLNLYVRHQSVNPETAVPKAGCNALSIVDMIALLQPNIVPRGVITIISNRCSAIAANTQTSHSTVDNIMR